jgi:hypothetical protein
MPSCLQGCEWNPCLIIVTSYHSNLVRVQCCNFKLLSFLSKPTQCCVEQIHMTMWCVLSFSFATYSHLCVNKNDTVKLLVPSQTSCTTTSNYIYTYIYIYIYIYICYLNGNYIMRRHHHKMFHQYMFKTLKRLVGVPLWGRNNFAVSAWGTIFISRGQKIQLAGKQLRL